MKRMGRRAFVDQEDLRVRRHPAWPRDMEGGGPGYVHAISGIGSRGKRRDRLRDGCNRQFDEERRRGRARRQPVSEGPATRRRSEHAVRPADESQLQKIPSTEHLSFFLSNCGKRLRGHCKAKERTL